MTDTAAGGIATHSLGAGETKASYKTSGLVIHVLMVIAILIASAMADEESDFGTQEAFQYLTLLSVGYMVGRGLARSGTRTANKDYDRGGSRRATRTVPPRSEAQVVRGSERRR